MAGLAAGGLAGAPFGPMGVAAGAISGYGLVKSAQRMAEGETLTAKKLISDLTMGTLFQGVPPAIMPGMSKVVAPYAKKFTTLVTDKLNQ